MLKRVGLFDVGNDVEDELEEEAEPDDYVMREDFTDSEDEDSDEEDQ